MDFSKLRLRASQVGLFFSKKNIESFKKDLKTKKELYYKTFTYLEENPNSEAAKRELLSLKEDIVNMESSGFELSSTAKKAAIDLYIYYKYGIKKEIYSKYFESGKLRENQAIEIISTIDEEFYKKCELPRKFNDYIEGECDILYPSVDSKFVIDVKSCWDMHTFLKHSSEIQSFLENDSSSESNIDLLIYKLQIACYCELYNVDFGFLKYVLTDMPESISTEELKRISWKYPANSLPLELAIEEFLKSINYKDIPLSERVITYFYKRNKEDYEDIILTVKSVRTYLKKFHESQIRRSKKDYFSIDNFIEENSKTQKNENKNSDINLGNIDTNNIHVIENGKKELEQKICSMCDHEYDAINTECPMCGFEDKNSKQEDAEPLAEEILNNDYSEFESNENFEENKSTETDSFVENLNSALAVVSKDLDYLENSNTLHVVSDEIEKEPIENSKDINEANEIESSEDEDLKDIQPIINDIQSSKSIEELMDIMSGIDDETSQKYPMLYNIINSKRLSLLNSNSEKKPKAEDEKKINQEQEKKTITKDIDVQINNNFKLPEFDKSVFEGFEKEIKEFNNPAQVKEFYLNNKAAVNSNPEFRKKLENLGKELSKKVSDEAKKQAAGN